MDDKVLEEINKMRELIEKLENDNKKLVDSLVHSLEREQDKNEITVKTIKEITKQNAVKEVLIVAIIVIFLLIFYKYC